MQHGLTVLGIIALTSLVGAAQTSRGKPDRPAPPPSRFSYTLTMDPASLPPGVTAKENKKGQATGFFMANTSDTPLIVKETFSLDKLVGGTKLVSGKVYFYFPNGIPMEGKQHLKGWQIFSDEIKQTIVTLPNEPATISANRKPGVPKNIPAPESFVIPVKYDGKEQSLRGTVRFHLNPEYDAYHEKKEK